MSADTYELSFNGGLLERGFWLYVWEIKTQENTNFYYVGRTGDSSSLNAQSPFNRMGQHLGFRKESNARRRQLEAKGITPEKCSFRLVARGPIIEEGHTPEEYYPRRDRIAAMEKALADAMAGAGYAVLNIVTSSIPLDKGMFTPVGDAFAAHFPGLKKKET